MPYFTLIEGTSENQCGMFSRGYGIHRRGKIVTVEWGGVFVRRGRRSKVCWIGKNLPQTRDYRHRSVKAAIMDYKARVKHRVGYEGYTRIPFGKRIVKFRRSLLNPGRS